jgi:pSer/pThr/pTyr-binding forkhead associated (FHA) protein
VEILFAVKSKADNSVQNVRYPLNGRLLLGRGPDNAVLLDGTGISREHLAIEREDSALFVTDLSTNGTWINGKRVPRSRKCEVGEEDSIEVPGYEIRYRMLNSTADEPAGAFAAKSRTAIQPAFNPKKTAGQPLSRRPALSILGSLTLLEKFLMLVALVSLGLLLAYLNS